MNNDSPSQGIKRWTLVFKIYYHWNKYADLWQMFVFPEIAFKISALLIRNKQLRKELQQEMIQKTEYRPNPDPIQNFSWNTGNDPELGRRLISIWPY